MSTSDYSVISFDLEILNFFNKKIPFLFLVFAQRLSALFPMGKDCNLFDFLHGLFA